MYSKQLLCDNSTVNLNLENEETTAGGSRHLRVEEEQTDTGVWCPVVAQMWQSVGPLVEE